MWHATVIHHSIFLKISAVQHNKTAFSEAYYLVCIPVQFVAELSVNKTNAVTHQHFAFDCSRAKKLSQRDDSCVARVLQFHRRRHNRHCRQRLQPSADDYDLCGTSPQTGRNQ